MTEVLVTCHLQNVDKTFVPSTYLHLMENCSQNFFQNTGYRFGCITAVSFQQFLIVVITSNSRSLNRVNKLIHKNKSTKNIPDDDDDDRNDLPLAFKRTKKQVKQEYVLQSFVLSVVK